MRVLAILILLSTVLPSSAQQTEIVSFDGNTITWSNSPTVVECGIEWAMDPSFQWTAISYDPQDGWWEIAPTTTVCSATWVSLFTNHLVNIPECGQDIQDRSYLGPHFFRMYAADEPLTNALRFDHHNVRVANLSAAALTDMVFEKRYHGSSIPLTAPMTLASGATSAYVRIDGEQLDLWGYVHMWTNRYSLSIDDGWVVTFRQQGDWDGAANALMPIGPTNKLVTVHVTDSNIAIEYEWLGTLINVPR